MTNIESQKIFIIRILILIVFTLQISSCTGQVKEKPVNDTTENRIISQPINSNQSTIFPQIHTNLNGMVRQFVRTMYQDKRGNYWFGTNGDVIIRYDGQTLEIQEPNGIIWGTPFLQGSKGQLISPACQIQKSNFAQFNIFIAIRSPFFNTTGRFGRGYKLHKCGDLFKFPEQQH